MGTFFNPFESQKGGGGGGGGDSSTYSVRKIVDSATEQVSYRLTKTTNGSTIDVGEIIAFTGDEVLVDYDGQTILLNAAVENLKELAEQGKQEVTFSSLEIDTHNKTISQLSAELAAKNLEEGTVVTGRVYSEALPYNNYGNAEVLVNNSIFWWKTSSSTISPYSWNAIVVGNTVKMDWTPTYYQLPIASAQSLGGVKIGDNVQIAPDGTISVITTKGDTGTGIASIAKTSSSGLNDIYTITYTDSTTSTFTVTNGATITGGSIGQTGHLILTMSDGRTIDAGALPTDNEVEVTTTSSQPADPNVELWVDLSTQQTLDIPEINDSSTSSTQDTWSCKKIYDEQQRQETEMGDIANRGAKNLLDVQSLSLVTASNATVNIAANDSISVSGSLPASYSDYSFMLQNIGRYIVTFTVSNFSNISGTYGKLHVRYNNVSLTTDAVNIDHNGDYVETFECTATNLIMRFIANLSSTTGATSFSISNFMIRPASITDSTFVPYAKTNRELTVENASQQSEINYAVNTGVKNLLKITGTTRSSNGIKYTVNQDGTVAVTGTATANSFFMVGSLSGYTGDVILSGCPANGGYQKWRLFKEGSDLSQSDTGNGMTYTLDGTSAICMIEIYGGQGFTDANPLIFRPMLRPASITDSTFQTYALPNPVLTPALIEQVDEGAKNLLKIVATSQSYDDGNITFTVNTDQTVTVNATNNHTQQSLVLAYLGQEFYGKTVVISGCPVGGNFSTGYYLLIYKASGSTTIAYDIGDSVTLTIPNEDCRIAIGVRANAVVNNLVFKPMICTTADYVVTTKFVPYAMSNVELTNDISTKLSMTEAYGYDIGYALSGTVDLDNLTTVGIYYYTAAAGTTITHAPTSSPFRLEVIQSAGAERYCQFMFANAENALYFRNLVGSTWTGWYKINATAV